MYSKMRELVRQMTEFEAEENEEEIADDEEFRSALRELRLRLQREEEEDEDESLGDR